MEAGQATRMLVQSFAQSIHGNDLIKEALTLTMISATTIARPDGSKMRGDINVFMMGDPGVAKSEMGMAVERMAPRAIYTSGRGSTGGGLTASTILDKGTGLYMIEPGVTVRADGGLVVVDEFDKMRQEDRSSLHEVMEQQIVSLAKGGRFAKLNARTGVIAIANPQYGRYDTDKTLPENIPSIPPTLLSRFDLIFIMRDTPDQKRDEEIMNHVEMSYVNGKGEETAGMDAKTFKKFIRIAKSHKPKLTKAAWKEIKAYYRKMRGYASDDVAPITMRQFEGLVRLTTAHAKMLLKNKAGVDDAKRAIEITDKMLKSSTSDLNTGKVDMGVIRGAPSGEKNQRDLFMSLFRSLLDINGENGVKEFAMINEMVATEKWDQDRARAFFDKMHQGGHVIEKRGGRFFLE